MTDNNQKPNDVYLRPETFYLVPYRHPEPKTPEVKESFQEILVKKIEEAQGPDKERKDGKK